jgi:hypothetical protein
MDEWHLAIVDARQAQKRRISEQRIARTREKTRRSAKASCRRSGRRGPAGGALG